MSRSDHATGQMSTYRFPDELRVDELLLRDPIESDIETIAPAFRDPAVGGEASLPPVDADTLRVMLRDQLPGMRAQGLLAAYVIQDIRNDDQHMYPAEVRRLVQAMLDLDTLVARFMAAYGRWFASWPQGPG